MMPVLLHFAYSEKPMQFNVPFNGTRFLKQDYANPGLLLIST